MNRNNQRRAICITKYFQAQNRYLFDITDEQIVLRSNNIEPAILQITLTVEKGKYKVI